jgi:hypothetical protein
VTATLATLLNLDDELGRHAFPRMSEWWRGEAARFYGRPGVRVWGAQVGRGGAKSTVLAKVALNEVLFGEWRVPPGERHFGCIVSENVTEAGGRLRLLEAYLTDLGIKYTRAGDVIELDAMRLGFRVLAARVGAVSGFRAVFLGLDEEAKFRGEGAANPAADIVVSARAMTVTHPNAKELHFSSPVSVVGFHYELIAKGDTDRQIVSRAATWIANPSITEAQTRELEPDEASHANEYEANPRASAGLALGPAEHIERAFGDLHPSLILAREVKIFDPSNMGSKSDGFGVMRAGWAQPSGRKTIKKLKDADGFDVAPLLDERGEAILEDVPTRPVLRVTNAYEIKGGQLGAYHDLIADEANDCKARGIDLVISDQRDAPAIEALLSRYSLAFRAYSYSATSKDAAIVTLRRLLREGTLSIAPNEDLRREMLSLSYHVSSSGTLIYETTGRDLVSCLVTLAHALNDGDLYASSSTPRARFEGAPGGGSRARFDLRIGDPLTPPTFGDF